MMKPTSDPLEFATELIMRMIPGTTGKVTGWVVFLVCFLIGAAVFVLELLQWIGR